MSGAGEMLRRLPAWSVLPLFIAITLGVGFLGAQVSAPEIPTWYAQLKKPALTPPSWVFGPVWTSLYLMMAVAGWLVWRTPSEDKPREAALRAYWIQLALHVTWPLIFFHAKDPGWAFVEILFLIAALLITMLRFAFFSLRAAALLLPDLAWITYATFLTLRIWQLNPRA